MKKSKEELTRIHKEKCRELKEIRARMAEDLGIELHQRECTYEGYCSGTCPACRKEEMQINAALLKKQMEETNLKGRIAAAGLTTMAALCLTGCNTSGQPTEGDMAVDGDIPPETYEYVTEGEPYEYMEEGQILPETSEDPAQSSCEIPETYEYMEEGEILPETSEDPAQSSCQMPEKYDYTELEGDFAIPETEERKTVD